MVRFLDRGKERAAFVEGGVIPQPGDEHEHDEFDRNWVLSDAEALIFVGDEFTLVLWADRIQMQEQRGGHVTIEHQHPAFHDLYVVERERAWRRQQMNVEPRRHMTVDDREWIESTATMRKWLRGQDVNSEQLQAELDRWAGWARKEPPDEEPPEDDDEPTFDLSDPLVREMALRNHTPTEYRNIGGALIDVRCEMCRQIWPCETRRTLRQPEEPF